MDYKNSYFAEFTKEVTTIELDSVEFDRWGEVEYDEDDKPIQIMRASRYTSKKNELAKNYDVYINQIAQHTLNELTLQRDDVLKRIVNRLAQMDDHIDDAWKVYFEQNKLWWDGKFSSLDFEWKFFHFFNIPVTRSAGMMENPDFEKGKTTDNFFWDIHDAMMYKQGAVKWVLWHLREQLGVQHPQEEVEPKDNNLPSVDRRITKKITQDVFAQLYHYCLSVDPKVDRTELAARYEISVTQKLNDRISYYHYPNSRTGAGSEGSKTYKTRFLDFEAVIALLKEEGNSDAARRAETEFSAFKLNNHSNFEE